MEKVIEEALNNATLEDGQENLSEAEKRMVVIKARF